MRRPQFSLKALLVAILAVACFLGGMALQRRLDEPEWVFRAVPDYVLRPGEFAVEIIRLRDGSEWCRTVYDGEPLPARGAAPVLPEIEPQKQPAPIPHDE